MQCAAVIKLNRKKSLIPDRLSPIGRTDRLRISTSYSIGRSRSLAIFHRSQFGVDYQEARAALWSELLRIRCEPDLMPLILGCATQQCRGRFSALQDAASIFAALCRLCQSSRRSGAAGTDARRTCALRACAGRFVVSPNDYCLSDMTIARSLRAPVVECVRLPVSVCAVPYVRGESVCCPAAVTLRMRPSIALGAGLSA